MSGGHFDYDQYRLGYISDSIKEVILNSNIQPEYWYGEWNGQVYNDKTIEEFKKAIAFLQIALCYAQRVDWLLSGDDGEDNFITRLEDELNKLKQADEYGYVSKILESKI